MKDMCHGGKSEMSCFQPQSMYSILMQVNLVLSQIELDRAADFESGSNPTLA